METFKGGRKRRMNLCLEAETEDFTVVDGYDSDSDGDWFDFEEYIDKCRCNPITPVASHGAIKVLVASEPMRTGIASLQDIVMRQHGDLVPRVRDLLVVPW